MNKEIAIIGLGKMGGALALNLKDKDWKVVGFNRTFSKTDAYISQGIQGVFSFRELISKLSKPRVVWLMLTAGEPTQNVLFGEDGLINYLEENDIVIEGGNSFYKDDNKNALSLKDKGIKYIDVGVSGGPSGARNGACLMIGGEKQVYSYLEPLFKDLAINNGYKYFEGYGAGHFVKMVHNGIEYGMMQAIAEGFNIMKKIDYNLNLEDVADIYNNGSVIESRLINWVKDGFKKYGVDLNNISGSVAQNGEGLWTVETAKNLKVEVPVIKESVNFRLQSQKNPDYTGQLLSMMRNMFGKHEVNKSN